MLQVIYLQQVDSLVLGFQANGFKVADAHTKLSLTVALDKPFFNYTIRLYLLAVVSCAFLESSKFKEYSKASILQS